MSTVLHVLDHSLPMQSGYASRSHSVLKALADDGYSVMALTGPRQEDFSDEVEMLDGIQYQRSRPAAGPTSRGLGWQIDTIRATRESMKRLIRKSNIALIHAHSPCLNGLAAIGTGIPFVYEMRSSWEDAAVSEGMTTAGSLRYRASRALETIALKRAAHTFVICAGLRREVVSRGITAAGVTVVPNAIQSAMFDVPSDTDVKAVLGRHGLHGRRVIAYYGSFFEWEGIHTLIDALPAVLEFQPDAVLLLAGGGRAEASIREMVVRLELSDHVVFAGRIDSRDMPAYYKSADVMVYPRISNRLTEMVTPLKPLEAMAMEIPVIASDIGGHRELIEDRINGYLYRTATPEELGRQILEVLSTDSAGVICAAREYVERERRWSTVVQGYRLAYAQLGIVPG